MSKYQANQNIIKNNSFKLKKIIILSIALALLSCSSNKVNSDNGNIIYMSTDRAPKECKFIAEMKHLHDTFSIGVNPDLSKNTAMALVDEAKQLGANYIELDPDRTGDAYLCPAAVLKKMNKHNWNN